MQNQDFNLPRLQDPTQEQLQYCITNLSQQPTRFVVTYKETAQYHYNSVGAGSSCGLCASNFVRLAFTKYLSGTRDFQLIYDLLTRDSFLVSTAIAQYYQRAEHLEGTHIVGAPSYQFDNATFPSVTGLPYFTSVLSTHNLAPILNYQHTKETFGYIMQHLDKIINPIAGAVITTQSMILSVLKIPHSLTGKVFIVFDSHGHHAYYPGGSGAIICSRHEEAAEFFSHRFSSYLNVQNNLINASFVVPITASEQTKTFDEIMERFLNSSEKESLLLHASIPSKQVILNAEQDDILFRASMRILNSGLAKSASLPTGSFSFSFSMPPASVSTHPQSQPSGTESELYQEAELASLQSENERLREENDALKAKLASLQVPDNHVPLAKEALDAAMPALQQQQQQQWLATTTQYPLPQPGDTKLELHQVRQAKLESLQIENERLRQENDLLKAKLASLKDVNNRVRSAEEAPNAKRPVLQQQQHQKQQQQPATATTTTMTTTAQQVRRDVSTDMSKQPGKTDEEYQQATLASALLELQKNQKVILDRLDRLDSLDKLDSKNERLRGENERLKGEREQLRGENEQLTEKNKRLMQENEHLSGKNIVLNTKESDGVCQQSKQAMVYAALLNLQKEMNAKLGSMDDKIKQLKQINEQLKRKNERLNGERKIQDDFAEKQALRQYQQQQQPETHQSPHPGTKDVKQTAPQNMGKMQQATEQGRITSTNAIGRPAHKVAPQPGETVKTMPPINRAPQAAVAGAAETSTADRPVVKSASMPHAAAPGTVDTSTAAYRALRKNALKPRVIPARDPKQSHPVNDARNDNRPTPPSIQNPTRTTSGARQRSLGNVAAQ